MERSAIPSSQASGDPYIDAVALMPRGELLSTIEVASHRTFFDSFRRVLSDDNGLYAAQFNILLGAYCNTLSLVKFLELGLSVACVCTKFPELTYVDEGTIQFEVQHPMIAQDGPHPTPQPQYNYMSKRISRRTLQAAFVIASEALGLLSRTTSDGTQIAEHLRLRATQQLARNVQTVLDSFERGTADQMLRVLLAKAPPATLLIPLSRCLDEGRLAGQVARALLISELKRRVVDDSFFLTKFGSHREAVLSKLTDLVSCTRSSVAVPRLTHTDTRGRSVDGVLVTTAMVRQRLLQGIVALADTQAQVPVTYGEMMISGTNLVTALVMGRAVRNLNDVAHHLLNVREETLLSDQRELHEELDERPQTATVRADLVLVGERLIFLEALDRRIYQATNVPYPLVGNMDLTFILPLGIFKRAVDRYSRHSGTFAPPPGRYDPRMFPPRNLFFFNKDGQIVRLSMESSIGTLCHPSVLDIEGALAARRQNPPPLLCSFGAYVALYPQGPLDVLMREFLEAWDAYLPPGQTPRWVIEQLLTPQQFVAPSNTHLPFELHPVFDLFVMPADVPLPGPLNIPATMATVEVSWRIINGNIPVPLCPGDFRDGRGQELLMGHRVMAPNTLEAVRGTFADPNYPVVFYLVEAVIHASERVFCSLLRLVTQCIRGYWLNARRLAFVNSFPMLMFIHTYLGSGELPEDCAAVYRDLVDHLHALRRVISEHTLPAPPLGGWNAEDLNHLLTDPAFLPPLLGDCDALMYRDRHRNTRDMGLRVGAEDGYQAVPGRRLQDADFAAHGRELMHNLPVRARPPGQPAVPHHNQDWCVLAKLFYWCVVPAFARGRCCTMGVRYVQVYAIVQSAVVPDLAQDEIPPTSTEDLRHPLHPRNLIPNSLNVLFHNAHIIVDSDALLTLNDITVDVAERTTPILAGATPDPGALTAGTRFLRTFDAALHHGLLMMAYPAHDETVALGTWFYPAPVHALFSCPDHLATLPGLPPRVLDIAREIPPVPPFLSANYFSSVRQPVVHHVTHSHADENVLTYALVAGYFKMSPVAFWHQLRTGFHPGLALTVVRQDRFQVDYALFAERASEAYFMGTLQVTRHNSAGGLNFTLSQPRANVDLGVGFTAACTSAALRTPLTDMGNLAQNLHFTRGAAPMLDPEVDDFLRTHVSMGNRVAPTCPAPFLGPALPATPPGLDHGQMSVCEFIVTPVSADLDYFRSPCNPRGRAAGAAYSGEGESDAADLMYDHQTPDPAHPDRATNNPWASQQYSYGDRLYNGAYNLSGASPLYSPCFKFFTPTEVMGKGRCLSRLISEAGAACSLTGGDSEVQFKRPSGTLEFIEDPCSLFQEAYPLYCASDQALMRAPREGEVASDEEHLAQYLIRDASPIRGCLPRP